MMAFIKWLLRGLLRVLYRVDCEGLDNYRNAGDRVLIVANHTSLLDGLLLYAWLPETPTFAINTQIARRGLFRPFLRFVELFEMDPTNPLSLKSMIKYLREGNKAVVFPEGRITVTGGLMKIYEGPGVIADRAEAMVLPIGIDGPQQTPFSYMQGRTRIRWFPRVTIRILPPRRIDIPAKVQGHERRVEAARQLQDIMHELYYSTFNHRKTVFEAFLDAVQRFGRKQVIIEDIQRQPLTYGQLLLRTFILGGAMRSLTRTGEHVGLMLPNTLAMAVSILALQYLGRVPALLNFTAGAKGVLSACRTAKVERIFTAHAFVEKADLGEMMQELEQHIEIIYLEDLRDRIGLKDKLLGVLRALYARNHYRRHTPDRDPDQAAVILFTSGTEGDPKGVMLSHSNLLSNYAQVRCLIDFRTTDVLFSALPLFHSFGVNAAFLMPLLGGSRIFLYPTPLHYRIIPELVYELQATILFGTDTFFRGYARHADSYDFYSLRYAVAGAEKLREETLQLWMKKFGIRILQGYGVTEASPVVSVNTPMNNKPGTVGRPVVGLTCKLDPVEGIEEGGKLVVKGPNIMLGYLLARNPGELVPPETERGTGWYDTGDITNIDEDGFITILGRAKRFAKIGGEMISLAAVEELAQQVWPGHSHAAVNLPDERKGEKIVLLSEHAEADRKALMQYAQQHGYSELHLPRQVVHVKEIPVLGTGKTDYRKLQTLAEEADSASSETESN